MRCCPCTTRELAPMKSCGLCAGTGRILPGLGPDPEADPPSLSCGWLARWAAYARTVGIGPAARARVLSLGALLELDLPHPDSTAYHRRTNRVALVWAGLGTRAVEVAVGPDLRYRLTRYERGHPILDEPLDRDGVGRFRRAWEWALHGTVTLPALGAERGDGAWS